MPCVYCVRTRLDDDRRCKTQLVKRIGYPDASGLQWSLQSCSRCVVYNYRIDSIGQCCSRNIIFYTIKPPTAWPHYTESRYTEVSTRLARVTERLIFVGYRIESSVTWNKSNKNMDNNNLIIFLQIDVVALACVRASRLEQAAAMRRPSGA